MQIQIDTDMQRTSMYITVYILKPSSWLLPLNTSSYVFFFMNRSIFLQTHTAITNFRKISIDTTLLSTLLSYTNVVIKGQNLKI